MSKNFGVQLAVTRQSSAVEEFNEISEKRIVKLL